MDVEGFHILVTKKLLQGKIGCRYRNFFLSEMIDKQRNLASQYAEVRGEDFLIVQVTEEIHAGGTVSDRIGQYFLLNKHLMKKGEKPRRRNYFDFGDVPEQRSRGLKYAAESGDDFLICKVIEEISASPAAKRKARQLRSANGA